MAALLIHPRKVTQKGSQGLVVRYSQFRKSCEDEQRHGASAVDWKQLEAVRRKNGRRPYALRLHGRLANECRADCAGEVGVRKEGACTDGDSG